MEAPAYRYKIQGEYGWSDWVVIKAGAIDLDEYRRSNPDKIIVEELYPPADRPSAVSPKMLAAAWKTWHARHGSHLGPGPAFSEAITAALAAMPEREQFQAQPWQGESAQSKGRFENHEEAMHLIHSVADVLILLSAEEIALGYARARGFIRDNSTLMCGPLTGAAA